MVNVERKWIKVRRTDNKMERNCKVDKYLYRGTKTTTIFIKQLTIIQIQIK